MKKLLFLFIGLLLSLISIMGQTIVTYNGLRYQIENNTAIVGRQDKELSGDIVIPSSIICNGETYTVTGFVQPTNLTAWSGNTVTTEGGAFQSCQITSVEIPSSITTIAAGTFSGCHNLKRVKMEDNLEEIGAASFSDCTSLESIYIPDNVNSFGSYSNYGYVSYAFGGCSNLKTIIIPSKITVLLEGCFMGSGLEKIVIPKTITKLCDNCLFSKKLKEVKMEIADLSKLSYSPITFGSANEIDIDLFVPKGSISVYQEYEPWSNFMSIQEYGDEGEIFVPDQININYSGLRYIIKNGEATVARQSSSLSGNIVIPDKVRYKDVEYPVTSMIEPTDLVCYSNNTINCTGGAFQGSEIESISIPSSIISISAGAFQNCLNLKKVVLPSTVKILSAASFAGCENLEDINLPEGLTDLASGTKYGYRSYVFGGCLKIKSIEIPLGVKSLASGCFKNSGLENVSIPANCISMGNDCLNAPNLQTVTMYVRDLDKLSYTESCFGDVSNTTLRVPNGS